MKHGGAAVLLLLAAALAGCRDANVNRNNTAVLGGHAQQGTAAPATPALTDAQGRTIPAPPAPAGTQAQAVRSGDASAVAAWVANGQVQAASWTPATGWSASQPLEQIHGEPGDVQLVSNGLGQAMAIWHHRVGNIHSLRFSRFDANGWSQPDVLPGAMPRPAVALSPPGESAPQLQMDAQGAVQARWPSGFRANEDQSARFTPATGWTRAVTAPVASAPSASPPSPSPSSAR